MDNVYVNLAGGIGNQLFQIACGYAYSVTYSKNLVLDASGWTASQGSNPLNYKDTFFKNFKFGKAPQQATTISEKHFNYSSLPNVQGDVILSGYFQSFKYFSDYANELISKFDFSEFEKWKTKIDIQPNFVGVHVRLGDYLRFQHIHKVCDSNYYNSCINKFGNNYQFYVLSDDINNSAKIIAPTNNIAFVQTGSELSDLSFLSHMPNIIASNSTFSWWASLFGCKKESVLVPNKWFNNFNQDYSDIYRSDFIKVSV